MKSSNGNGKIVIAILVMFAVALSIVGVTYAYFTTRVNYNENTESVTVDAGKLVATYTGGSQIILSNVLPGWQSDGATYFDASKIGTDGHLACTTAADDATFAAAVTSGAATETNGLRNPVKFTVTNPDTTTADKKVDYVVTLTVSENTFAAADLTAENVYATLYKGSYTDYTSTAKGVSAGEAVATVKMTDAVAAGADAITYVFGTANEVQSIQGQDASEDYYVIFYYKNNGNQDASQSTNAEGTEQDNFVSLKAKVGIVGVQQQGGVWYDADNNAVFGA